MRRTLCHTAILLILTALVGFPATASDKEPQAGQEPDMDAMMAAMEAAASPGDQHEFLAGMAGEWTFVSTLWMDPSQPPVKSDGTSSKKMILGDRYLVDHTSGEAMGQPFEGQGLTGYDNTAGEFVGTWIDSMSTSIANFEGQLEGDTLTLHSEWLDPVSREMAKVRAVTRVIDKDHHVFEYYMTMPGAPEFKSMQIDYTRAK